MRQDEAGWEVADWVRGVDWGVGIGSDRIGLSDSGMLRYIGMIWYGMVWCGMCGMVWYGVVWCGMVWHGMVW